MGGRSRQPTGMARGLGQDVGKARASPVSTRGFPRPLPGYCVLEDESPVEPLVPTLPAPLACPTLSSLP